MSNPGKMVTVLITAYDEQENIEEAVKSALNQSHRPLEVLVVNDGSTDATGEIVKQIEDERIRLLDLERVGRIDALNKGIEASRGELIAILDADDRCLRKRVEKQHRRMVEDPEMGVVGSYYVRVDDIRNEKYIRCYPKQNEEIRREMSKYIPISHSCAMFRKRAVVDVGGYRDETRGLEDMDLWIRLAKHWKLANIADPLVLRRIRNDSYWHSNFSQRARNLHLAKLNARAVSEFSLPFYLYIFSVARLSYTFLPTPVKRTVRRFFSRIEEHDLRERLGQDT